MSAESARELVQHLEQAGAPVWIDGGWAVDALLGRQTRDHGDLDIAIEPRHVGAARAVLTSLGFRDVDRDDTRRWNFVMGHPDGREVDFHVIEINERGDGVYGPPDNNDLYPANTLAGTGEIDGHPVRCLSADGLIEFRVDYPYPPRERDFLDVWAVCAHFGIPIPDKYRTPLR
jgi:lincosamide nucleotidyltransferase A/C/D/E